MTGLVLLLAVLALSTAFGVTARSRSGRLRPVRRLSGAAAALTTIDHRRVAQAGSTPAGVAQAGSTPAGVAQAGSTPTSTPHDLHHILAALGEIPGERATLLQFSSAFCAPCRATRRVLSDVAAAVPGVRHVEVDAEQHLDVVRLLKIHSTPTTLVLDRHGRVTARAKGQPRKDDVLAALGDAVA